MAKNRIVNNIGITLPMAFEGLVDLLDQYIQDALDTEDIDTFKRTPEEERLEDFILYVATIRNVKLLDVMHRQDVEKEV